MNAVPQALVRPDVLAWLRESAGLSVDEAARKAQLKPEKVASWEQPKDAVADRPSMPQLRRLAKAYKRPIHYFYLPKPVAEPAVPHDFRRLPEEATRRYSPALLHEIRLAYRRRSLALDLIRELGGKVRPFAAFASATLDEAPEALAARIRDLLGIDWQTQQRWREPRAAYNAWRGAIEAAGVLVFQVTTVEAAEMLGFSLAFPELPVIGINRKVRPNGRTFTVLHEFVHLLLGEGGVCDLEDEVLRPAREQQVEVFCNRVAGAALIPETLLLTHPLVASEPAEPQTWSDDAIAILARDFGVSREVAVRRLLLSGRATESFYRERRAAYAAQLAAQLAREQAEPNEMRRNMPREAASNLSGFARLVLDGYHADALSLAETSRLLGVKAAKVAAVDDMLR